MKKKLKAFFKNHPGLGLKTKEIAKKLDISEEHEYAELKHLLYKLVEEGYLEKFGKRYRLNGNETTKLIGTIQIINEGDFGFVNLTNGKDIFIAGKNLYTAFNGDKVEVKILPNKKGKNTEGIVIEIIERSFNEIVGTLHKSKSYYFVKPDDKKIHREFFVSERNLKTAKDGDKVVIGSIEWKSSDKNPEGKVIEILGKAGSYDAEIAAIAHEYGLSYKFPKKVLKEVEKISDEIPEEEYKHRLDLRNKIIFTIDPEDAKDYDDAVSIESLENGNFLVGIHIADVAYYVKMNSAIYEEALKRGTSVYIVGKVIPMLPERLSNVICSLVPYKDRLTFSVLAQISPEGKLLSYEIKKTIINSSRRFTYDEVQEIIEKQSGEFSEQIINLNRLAKKLRSARIKKGSINFFTPEVVFKLDKNGIPLEINIKQIKESNNLIEEFMLLANQIIAGHVRPKKGEPEIPFVYRIHDLPDKEKITEFARFVKSLGYSFDPNAANKSKQFQKLLDNVKGKEEEAVVNEIAIRSMAKAVYSTNNIGHYGLGFKYYSHFTSPIRRFPDLIVHQIIYNVISGTLEKNLSVEELEEICDHSSAQERNAINAERLSVKLKQIEYLKSKVGKEFNGLVSGITNFGIFIELNDTLAEGMIKLRDLEDDYYIFDEKNYSITGRRYGKRIRLGDKVKVKLIRVDEEKREIDFYLIN